MNRRKLRKAIRRLWYLPANRKLPAYLFNKLRHFWYKLIRSTKVAYPSTIMIELTNHCNLACTICPREYGYGKEMDKGNMDVEQAKRIIDEMWPYLDSIGLTGMGETFIFQQLEEIVDYIKQKNKGIIISVSTNAVLPGFIEKASRIVDKIDTIQISIDGIDEIYNSIRLKSDFRLLEENIKKLRDLCKNSHTELMLNMVVTKENYMHMPVLVEYADKIGISYLDFTLFNLASVTDIPASYYQFYKSEEFLAMVEKMDQAAAAAQQVQITGRNFETDNSFRKCPFPWTHFYVTQDGFVTPCCAKPFPKEKNFGNVKDGSLMDILNSTSFREWRVMWFENKTPGFCQKCHFIDLEPVSRS